MNKKFTLVFFTIFSMHICFAQVVPPSETENIYPYPQRLEQAVTPTENAFTHNVDAYYMFLPSSGVDYMNGSVEVARTEAEYSLGFKLFEQLPIELSLSKQYLAISQNTGIDFPNHLNGLTFDFETTLPFFFKNTYFRLGVSPSYYTDSFSFPASSFRIPSRYFVIYQPNDKWTFIGGIAVYPDYKNEIGPIFGCIYKASDRLVFEIIPTHPVITYDLTKKTSLFAEGGFFSEEYEVTRNNVKGVVLMYDDAYAGGGLKFKLNKFINASFSGGAVFGRSLKYRDKRGKANINDGLYGQFRIEAQI